MSEELRISIEKLVYGGDGLAHADGNTVFVPYVLPGEEVRAAAKAKRKKLVWAKLLEVTSASAQREGARCPHFQTCGGTIAAEERDFAGDALAARRDSVERGDSGALRPAVRIQESGAMGGAKRQSARDWIFFAGEFGDCADR